VAGRFGSRQLAVAALQMRDTIPTNNKRTDKLPRFAILRWLDQCGHSKVLVFGPEGCLSTEAARFLTC
jgi:16S rRNA U1498 N3-methylase RsmE